MPDSTSECTLILPRTRHISNVRVSVSTSLRWSLKLRPAFIWRFSFVHVSHFSLFCRTHVKCNGGTLSQKNRDIHFIEWDESPSQKSFFFLKQKRGRCTMRKDK